MKNTPRKLSKSVLSALKNNPVVFVNGPRQAGKSTLVQALSKKEFPAEYVTFDNATQMAAASVSPETFLGNRKKSLIIDEVQIVPDLFRALKLIVDELRIEDKANSNGRFLLTGSANIMALPQLSDSLVGRMSVKTLYPFAASEILGGRGDFIESVFAKDFSTSSSNSTLTEQISFATFPEISGVSASERSEWFESYITTILQRDVRLLADIEKIAILPNLLRIIAARAGKLINDADISRDAGLNPVTSKSYRGILQAMFLQFDIAPWYRNIGKRLVKSPKAFLTDTLLLCHLLGQEPKDMQIKKPEMFGHILENYVATELTKLLSFGNVRAKLLHFRTSDNKEVDFILERPDGTLAGIEVKASDRADNSDFKGLRTLKEITGNDFICGIVLYTGKDIVTFGDNLFAVPVTCLAN